MSPAQIKIMLHYYTTRKDMELPIESIVVELVNGGMLEHNQESSPVFSIAQKGRAYIQKLCSIPIPTEQITYNFAVEE